MINFKGVWFRYESQADTSEGISELNLNIEQGECVVLCGVSGCGKTTVTRMINGLIPHFFPGDFQGQVKVDGFSNSDQTLAQIAQSVGTVFQNPRTQFFNVDTTSELAFGCENLGLDPTEIKKRIGEAVSAFQLENLLDRSIFKLSGGEKQRIACGSVYATYPDIFVLDEPSASLDSRSIAQLQAVIHELKRLGKTIVVSEHRLYYLSDIADRFVYMENGRISGDYSAEDFKRIPEHRRREMGLRTMDLSNLEGRPYAAPEGQDGLRVEKLLFKRGKREILNIPQLQLNRDEVVALIGHNGAGKSSFAHCICGLERFSGHIRESGKQLGSKALVRRSFMVMQDVNSQLFTESVREELILNTINPGEEAVDEILSRLNLLEEKERHPNALSGGQKQRVAMASAMIAGKDILVYDEPTSGLDYANMLRMSSLIGEMERNTSCTLIITHDLEFILATCHRVIELDGGRVTESYALDDEGILKLKEYFLQACQLNPALSV